MYTNKHSKTPSFIECLDLKSFAFSLISMILAFILVSLIAKNPLAEKPSIIKEPIGTSEHGILSAHIPLTLDVEADGFVKETADIKTEEKIIETKEPEEKQPATYIVKSGDNFWNICKEIYGDGNYYNALIKFNNYEGKTLHVGDEIKTPDINDESFKLIKQELDSKKTTATNNTTPTTNSTTSKKYKYGVRTQPAVEINVSSTSMKNFTGAVDTSNFEYVGNWTTTGYDPHCKHCCGKTNGIGAAGVENIPGYSCAAPSIIPLGTTIYIEGYGYYVVEDRGAFGKTNIDIACTCHDTCGSVTCRKSTVAIYIVK